MDLNEYLEQADHAYAELLAKRNGHPEQEKAQLRLQQSRMLDALGELIPEPLGQCVIVEWPTMTVRIHLDRRFLGTNADYVEARFTADKWLVEIATDWTIYVKGFVRGSETELIHAIGALRHELSKMDEAASAA